MRSISTRFNFVVMLGICSFASPVFAQPLDPEQATRDLVSQADLLRQNQDDRPRLSEAPVVEEGREEEAVPDAGPIFLVTKIIVEGGDLVPREELDAMILPFEGRKLRFGDLQGLANAVTAHYRKRGFTTTQAYLPPQKVKDGVVVLRVMEGRVGRVTVEGNRWFGSEVYLRELDLAGGDPFEMTYLEKALRDINLEPDRAVRAWLQPGEKAGMTDITLKAKDDFPVHMSYEYNLRGTKLTHRARHLTHLTHNNLFGMGDSLRSNFSTSEQGSIVGGSGYYEVPIPRTGTTWSLAGSVAESRLQKHLREFDVRGESWSVIPGVSQKLIETGDFYLDGALRLEVKNSKTSLGGQLLSSDRSRAVVPGLRAGAYDPQGQTMGAADLHIGVPDFMGGSPGDDPEASRLGAGGEFLYVTGNLARLQRLPYEAILVFQMLGQYSGRPLTSLEQMNLGGMFSVRGYPENDSSGDNGFSASTELRVPPYLLPADWRVPGAPSKKLREALSLAAFVEGGKVFADRRQTPESEKDRTLFGAGFGVRFHVSPDFNLQFDYGIPFGDPSSDKDRNQVHLSARIGF